MYLVIYVTRKTNIPRGIHKVLKKEKRNKKKNNVGDSERLRKVAEPRLDRFSFFFIGFAWMTTLKAKGK